ncbi:MAG TPA: ATP-grasp domain-containing protein, partial [Luteitalea sp.]|nr:ATP-grasp domain-containing protein [Luteitalea sp.]
DRAAIEPPMLLVEGFIPGREFALEGVLELGALRVFALFEKPGPRDGPRFETDIIVTPARLPSSRQQVLAGHIARAALALGLHHGPVHAWCRVDGDQIVVPGVSPRPIAGAGARAIPVIDPEGARVGLEDVLIAHALGRSLEGFGHEAVARGVLQLAASPGGQWQAVDGVEDVRTLPHVTGVHVTAVPGGEPRVSGGGGPGYVVAEAPHPGDVVEALHEAGRRLVVRAGG